ncbi:MAG: hypothetical protein HN403_15035 [Rhodospirillales bacterium]|nr:hypothetical protein [Rhodospirillales bacterium]
MSHSVLTPRHARSAYELDRCMAVARDARSEGLRQFAHAVRRAISSFLLNPAHLKNGLKVPHTA